MSMHCNEPKGNDQGMPQLHPMSPIHLIAPDGFLQVPIQMRNAPYFGLIFFGQFQELYFYVAGDLRATVAACYLWILKFHSCILYWYLSYDTSMFFSICQHN